MGGAKSFLEEVAMRDFGEVTHETLAQATPTAERELRAAKAIVEREHEERDSCPYCGQPGVLLDDTCPRCDRFVEAQ